MSTMSAESLNLSPGPPPTYQVATESLCGPGSYVPEAQNSTPVQWSEMPALGEIPVTCLEPPTHSPPVYHPPAYNPPAYNQQKFNHPNILNTNDFKRNYIDTSINHNRAINGIYLPNGVKVFNTNLLNEPPRPVLPNRAMMHGGNNWMTSTPNQNRLLNRPGWNAGKSLTSGRKPKRIRTAFTSQQMMELEQEYARTRYLDRTRRIELADILHLNERTIKIWFQNRRMKEKKDKAESLEEEEASSTTDSSSDLNGVPIVIHDHEVYNRSMYVEQYAPATPSNVVISSAMPMHHPGQTSMINGYVPYMPENYEQCQPSHLHLQQQFPPAYNSNIQEIIEDSPPSCEEVPNNSSNMTEQNWDLSWIKSININDDC